MYPVRPCKPATHKSLTSLNRLMFSLDSELTVESNFRLDMLTAQARSEPWPSSQMASSV